MRKEENEETIIKERAIKNYKEYRNIRKRIKERWEKKRIRKDTEKIKKAREIVREMPIENIRREKLIEKLRSTNIDKSTDEDLLQLSTLFYTTIEKWEEELGEETGKVEKCEWCGKEYKTKSTLGKHIANNNEECAQWYHRKKNSNKILR